MSKYVSDRRQDRMKEKLFKDTYGLDSTIFVTNYNDENWDWDKAVLEFVDSKNRKYGLIEHFNDGSDNDTNYVELVYQQNGEPEVETFDRYIDAELQLVELMRRKK